MFRYEAVQPRVIAGQLLKHSGSKNQQSKAEKGPSVVHVPKAPFC